jgi:ParB-like chromosome segregation protein Spo0J
MQNWPADRTERRKVSDLVPYARNARTHSASQVAQIADSIKQWGWTVPVLIGADNGIIAGHGRVEAAKLLGFEEVPVVVAEGWSPEQRRAYILADNQLPQNAGWDFDLVAQELSELDDAGFDVTQIGFSTAEMTAFFAQGKPPEAAEPTDEGAKPAEAAVDGVVKVGPYTATVSVDKMQAWLADLRVEHDDDRQQILSTILERLGLA